MSTRNRFDNNEQHYIGVRLCNIIDNVVKFHTKQYPLTFAYEEAVWHSGYDPRMLDAYRMMQRNGYLSDDLHWRDDNRTNEVVFAVQGPNRSLMYATRFFADGKGRFLTPPKGKNADFKVPMVKAGMKHMRVISLDDFVAACGQELTDKFHEWAMQAGQITQDANLAKSTIKTMMGMVKTVGQVRRMCPEILQYLSYEQQQTVMEQKRNSPFPEGWDTFDKNSIQHMLMGLARGHLLADAAKNVEIQGTRFPWAEFPAAGSHKFEGHEGATPL